MIRYDLSRFEKKVKELESYPIVERGLLLYGSSFFGNWGYDKAKSDLSIINTESLPIINHGFGGATIDELLYYYRRLVKDYNPKIVLIRGGPNDFETGYEVGETAVLLSRLCEWLLSDFPQVKIGLIPIFDVPKPELFEDKFFSYKYSYNLFCLQHAKRFSAVFVLDINEFFYENLEDVGSHRHFKPIFLEDGVHLNEDGYAQFALYLKKCLREYIK